MRFLSMMLVVTIALAAPVKAEPYDLRGFKLGMTLEEFKAFPFPDAEKHSGLHILCTGEPRAQDTSGAFHLDVTGAQAKTGLIRCKHFGPRRLHTMVVIQEVTLNVAGVQAFTDFEFLPAGDDSRDLRLFRINVHSNMMNWDQFWAAYMGKFGKPTVVENGVVQNAYGATFSKTVATWNNEESRIVLEQRSSSLKTMKIMYVHDAMAMDYFARLKRIEGNRADKL